jgi:aspartokinase-like uncharacterized kinase
MTLMVAKVGGSLFDLQDLRDRLRRWLATVAGPVLLVPGGGEGADVVRRLDRVHGLDDEAAHGLALRVLSVSAHLLAGLIGAPVESFSDSQPLEPDSRSSGSVTSPERKRRTFIPPSLTLRPGDWGGVAVLDPHAFCAADEGRPGALAHTWDVTSDSIAARVAEVVGADLVLLKSVDLPAGLSWEVAAAGGLVDATFGSIVARAGLQLRWVNLRRSLP